jgi:hypothetical protein
MILVMLGLVDGHPFRFDTDKYGKIKDDPKKLAEFNSERWHAISKVEEVGSGIVTHDFLEKIDRIYCDEVRSVDRVNIGLMVGTKDPTWIEAMTRYFKKVRVQLIDFAGDENDASFQPKLDWYLSTEDRGRPCLPLPTRSAIEDIGSALGSTPEAIKEVSQTRDFTAFHSRT